MSLSKELTVNYSLGLIVALSFQCYATSIVENVSLINLISTPQKYEGKKSELWD